MKVLFVAPVGDYDVKDGGYGNASTGIFHVLTKMHDDGMIKDLAVLSTLDLNKGREISIPKERYDVAIMVTHPASFSDDGTRNILTQILMCADRRYLSVVWETKPLPLSWEKLWTGELFTGFLAPSYFIGDQLKKVTKKPIYYYPHFINTQLFTSLDIQNKVVNEKVFNVLCMGQYTERKNINDTIIAFIRALGDKKDANLILKYHLMSNKELHIEKLIKFLAGCNIHKFTAGVHTLNAKLPVEEIVKLYQEASALLFISRGEGFGLPSGEAMSVGIPVIYSNWSALPEVSEAEGNYPITCMEDSAVGMAHYGYEPDSTYGVPNIKETEIALKTLYKEWKKNKKAYYKKVKDNRELIKDKFGLQAIKGHLKNILDEGETI